MKAWWVFIDERFPLGSHLPMIAAFVVGNSIVSHQVLGLDISWIRIALAFVLGLSFFFRLRLFDEIKDFETDKVINPHRPLPRGLLSVIQLKKAIVILVAVEALLVWTQSGHWIGLIWTIACLYSLLMYREFFIGDIIRPHLTTYAVMHTISSCFLAASLGAFAVGMTSLPDKLGSWLLVMLANWGFFNIFEFARKTFAPEHERNKVESYSKIFGLGGAIFLSISQAAFSLVIFSQKAPLQQWQWFALLFLTAMWALTGGILWKDRSDRSESLYHAISGIYLVGAYAVLALGLIKPLSL